MQALSTYDPLQRHALTRFGRLKMLQRDVLPKLDESDFRVRLTLKALYSTYRDLEELGLHDEAQLLRTAERVDELTRPTDEAAEEG
jgi:hypothetical protein